MLLARVESDMAVPKRRQSNRKTGSRRAHDGKSPKNVIVCSHCAAPVLSHAVCPKCGFYMGRKVVEVEL